MAGPELLLKQLKDALGREGFQAIGDLPHGIHSGLRREKCYGMFFYFQAPRRDGEGKRHFWQYIDAKSHEIVDNRFDIARMIACRPDEPRFVGDQDVFALQEQVIEHILSNERERGARSATANTIDPAQHTVHETLRNAMDRGSVDRGGAKSAMRYLKQTMGKSVLKRLKKAYKSWTETKRDEELLGAVQSLASDYARDDTDEGRQALPFCREDLELICFEYVSS